MECWAGHCQHYAFPTRPLASGVAEIRERHVERSRNPRVGILIKRIVVANLVVDQETITRTVPDGPVKVDVVAIYEIEGSKIAKAWFKMGSPRPHPRTA
jgi:hypothetical protein